MTNVLQSVTPNIRLVNEAVRSHSMAGNVKEVGNPIDSLGSGRVRSPVAVLS
jgi:hypothetical protein